MLMTENSTLTLGSLFDGSGGFPLGGLLCGITPVWASEIESFPIRVTTKRLPFMKHYGDISSMDGAKIEPVDIITFGSPCTDMSVAGKRAGLDGRQSVLFYQAIRIIKEMRCATDGRYPRYIVWENVPGAFSSNNGEDFRCVLEAVCGIADETVSVPRPAKWQYAGEIMADGYSVAWRTFDAQYWGVPQRRRRVYLVADLAGGSAGKVLFESESLSGYSPQSFGSWEGTARRIADCTGTAGLCLNDQGGSRMGITDDVTATLRAEAHHPPCVLESAGFCTEHYAKSRSIGYEKERAPTLRAGVVPAAVYENHSQDTRYTGPVDVAPTVAATYGTGGNNQPFVVKAAYGICSKDSNSMKSDNPHSGIYEADTSRTIDGNGGNPCCNQGGIAVVESYALQGSMIGRKDENGPQGDGINEDVSFTLNTVDRHAVCSPTYSASKSSFFTSAEEELANTLVASDYKDPPLINDNEIVYSVRRLTPTECARLQGFPDWWCDNLGTEEPTDADIAYWTEVWETHRRIVDPDVKPKTQKQIVKWLKSPHSDAAEYKMWGNGVALPNVVFVLSGIVWTIKNEETV